MKHSINISEEKFAELIDENQGRLRHLCRVYAERVQEEKDLFQEIIIQIWRSLPSFKGNAKLSTWMYRIGVNTAISHLRKKKTRQDYYASHKEEQEAKTAQQYTPAGEEEDEQTQKLYQTISKLNVSEKAMITMYMDDFSCAEIAFVTGITENYVGVKLNRIKKKLTKLIGE